jgi:hypothetical protein
MKTGPKKEKVMVRWGKKNCIKKLFAVYSFHQILFG